MLNKNKDKSKDWLDHDSDQELPQLDKKIEELKVNLTNEQKVKKLDLLQLEYKGLVNKRMEKVIQLRQRFKIKVDGDDAPELVDSFKKMKTAFKLNDGFMQKLKENGILKPTPVQMQGIPMLFGKRSSIILAQTGSGKSLAFITPLIHLLKNGDGLKALVISPTRELTLQLYKEFLIFNGSSKNAPRVKFLRKALFP